MAVLESCPKYNMIAYLEKTEGNAEFHEVIDFLAYITAKVVDKPVSISEASIRSDLLFNDADGIDSLPNQAIFDAIQLMGYEGDLTVLTFNKALFSPQWRHLDAKKKFVMYPRFISIFLDKQLVNVPVPLDHFPVNALTSKVFSFMVKKGKHFSGKVTPLFASMLVQSTEDEGATSERPSEPQPTPSPPHPSEANVEPQSDPSPRPSPTPHIPDSILEVSGGNQGGQSSSDRSLSGTEGGMTLQSIKKLKKQAKPVISHHRAWMKSISLKQRLAGKKSLKSNWMQKESVSKQGRKSAKAEPSVHKDLLFDELDDDEIDNMDTKDAQDMGRSRDVVNKEKENDDAEVSTEDVLSTAQQKVSTDKEKVSTDSTKVSTDGSKVSTDKEKDSTDRTDEGTDDQTEGRRATQTTQTSTSTMFGDDETIAQIIIDIKAFPKIDPKDKGKKKIEEEDESKTKFDEEERKRLAKEEATNDALIRNYDDIKARIEADRLPSERLQEEEREQFTVEERAKILHDTIAAQRKNFLGLQHKIRSFWIKHLQDSIKKSNDDLLEACRKFPALLFENQEV
ncbi:hypothetical protein Tco_0734734 [Tanacetum coccineum]